MSVEDRSTARTESSPLASLFTAYAGLQLLLALSSLVRNKVTAVNLGVAKFGEFAQLMNVCAFLVAIAGLGLGLALCRNMAMGDDVQVRKANLGTALTLTAVVSTAVALVALLAITTGVLLPFAHLPSGRDQSVAALIAVIAVPIICVQGLYIAALQGLLDARGMARSRGLAVVVATLAGIPLIVVWGLRGAVGSALLLALFTAVALGMRLRTLGLSPLSLHFDQRVARALLTLGMASAAISLAQAGADVVARGITLAHVGTRANGLLQAPLSVTALLQGILLGTVGAMIGIRGLPLTLFIVGLLLLSLNIICLDRAVGIRIPRARYAAIAVGGAVIVACWWLPTMGPLGMVVTAAILTSNLAICAKTYRSHL
jgi:ABC-type antimicrobial peptide transport system permease subunit